MSLTLLFNAVEENLIGMNDRKNERHTLGLFNIRCPELHKVGILVSRIPDIFGRKSGHFQIDAANLRLFGLKRLQHIYIYIYIH